MPGGASCRGRLGAAGLGRVRAESTGSVPREVTQIAGFICTFLGAKKYQKTPGPGPHKNHFQAGNFITRAVSALKQ